MLPAHIPSPEFNAIHLGPLTIHFYALCILAGIALATLWAKRRWEARGGNLEHLYDALFAGMITGIIGARIYHVITSPDAYFGPEGHLIDAFKIWNGGLGIWGGVAGGAVGAYFVCRKYGCSFAVLADVVAPTLLLGQAVGRLGNWFNQELYGGPSDSFWALEITCRGGEIVGCTPGLYQPTFLYEMLWNLAGIGVLLIWERSFQLAGGRMFWAYVIYYTAGRLWIETLRTDPAQIIFGQRLNVWTSLFMIAFGVLMFGILTRRKRVRGEEAYFAETPRESREEGSVRV
ncbi:prolipoprotein diacylglyceryl transferase [Dermabacteraceae bacterium P13115]|nr:prolipoprotein diacylglyceryl transferase [Dermabacteraceae bacterium TAE3-ERU5]